MVGSLSSKYHQFQQLKWLQITLRLRTIHIGVDLRLIVVMIIHSTVTPLGAAMVARIHVEMVLTITITGTGVIKNVEIKIGVIEISLVETPTCRLHEVCLGI